MAEKVPMLICFASPVVSTAKLILISQNCPPLRKSEIEYYAMLYVTHLWLMRISSLLIIWSVLQLQDFRAPLPGFQR